MVEKLFYAGITPFNLQHPWEFKSDYTFKTLRDGCHGTWSVQKDEKCWYLDM